MQASVYKAFSSAERLETWPIEASTLSLMCLTRQTCIQKKRRAMRLRKHPRCEALGPASKVEGLGVGTIRDDSVWLCHGLIYLKLRLGVGHKRDVSLIVYMVWKSRLFNFADGTIWFMGLHGSPHASRFGVLGMFRSLPLR